MPSEIKLIAICPAMLGITMLLLAWAVFEQGGPITATICGMIGVFGVVSTVVLFRKFGRCTLS
jgi:hypothetical protein